jgi:hypothetical protein
MATSTITPRHTQHYRDYRTSLGNSQIIPINTEFQSGFSVVADGAVFAAAFTPSATTCTVASSDADAISITGGTAREFTCIPNSAGNIEGAYLFRASARRKPGTTGAIVAQNVIISVNSVEIGRFPVLAANANEDPVVGYVEFFCPTAIGDTRVNLNTNPLSFGITAVDTDLEIFFEVVGDYLP